MKRSLIFVALLIGISLNAKLGMTQTITVTGPVEFGTEAGMTWFYVDDYMIGGSGLLPEGVVEKLYDADSEGYEVVVTGTLDTCDGCEKSFDSDQPITVARAVKKIPEKPIEKAPEVKKEKPESSSIFSLFKSNMPKCDDENVVATVKQIAETELKNQLTAQAIIEEFNTHPKVWGYPSYEQIMNVAVSNNDENAFTVMEYVEARYVKLNGFELSAIRPTAIDKELKKCSCAATLVFPHGGEHQIEYSAQETTDEQVYIEVFGL